MFVNTGNKIYYLAKYIYLAKYVYYLLFNKI